MPKELVVKLEFEQDCTFNQLHSKLIIIFSDADMALEVDVSFFQIIFIQIPGG